MTHRHRLKALVAAVAITLVSAQAMLANEFAVGVLDSQTYDGFQGNQGIRTDPAAVQGIAYVHIAQVIMAGPTDFVAIGTVKGEGTSGGAVNCVDHYEPANWSGYYDRVINGVYTCSNFSTKAYLAGSHPSFKIQWAFCQAVGANRWLMTFASAQRTCIFGPSSGVALVAGLETFGTVDRNIDVKWTNMKKNLTGTSGALIAQRAKRFA